MANVKVNLRKGQSYIGTKAYGCLKVQINEVVRQLLNGTIEINDEPQNIHESVSFRLTLEQVSKLRQLAKSKNISIQECLRRGMEASNLTSQL